MTDLTWTCADFFCGGGGIWVREAGVLRWHATSRGQADMRGDVMEA